ncbi:P-loop containing nucleoside triphosphate hydrolase protein [Paraphysoderma sedebokerense]|nr:P-loop containing nucleoside triphosphate hydrolase protein [Paraphysoderma sedebokerense]
MTVSRFDKPAELGGIESLLQDLRQAVEDSFTLAQHNLSLKIEPVRGFVLYGAQGVGKKSIVRKLCSDIEKDVRIIHFSILASLVQLKSTLEDDADEIKKDNDKDVIQRLFRSIVHAHATLVVIDDLDSLFKGLRAVDHYHFCHTSHRVNLVDQIEQESQQMFLRKFTAAIESLPPFSKILFVGTSTNVTLLPDLFSKSNHFSRKIEIPIPDKNHRIEICRVLLKPLLLLPLDKMQSPLQVENQTNNSENDHEQLHHQYSVSLAEHTAGYVAGDLAKVIRQAHLHALRKSDRNFIWIDNSNGYSSTNPIEINANMTSEDSIHRELEKMSLAGPPSTIHGISWADFEYALGIVPPSQQVESTVGVATRNKYLKWEDVGGYPSLKRELEKVVNWPLTNPEMFENLGVTPPGGVLLYGPSGCGKTMLVRTLANNSAINVVIVRGPEIVSKYLGESERILRELFARARRLAPCLLVVDELDSIGCRRDFNSSASSNVQERLLSTLLNEMDGISARKGVFIIGCTNRPDMIDDAVLRPGRLDQLIYVPPPTTIDRQDILEVLSKRTKLASDIDLSILAKEENTAGFRGADLSVLIRESAVGALREDMESKEICWKHLQPVLEAMKRNINLRNLHKEFSVFRKFKERIK